MTPEEQAVLLKARQASTKHGLTLGGNDAKVAVEMAKGPDALIRIYEGEGVGEVVLAGITIPGMQALNESLKGISKREPMEPEEG